MGFGGKWVSLGIQEFARTMRGSWGKSFLDRIELQGLCLKVGCFCMIARQSLSVPLNLNLALKLGGQSLGVESKPLECSTARTLNVLNPKL